MSYTENTQMKTTANLINKPKPSSLKRPITQQTRGSLIDPDRGYRQSMNHWRWAKLLSPRICAFVWERVLSLHSQTSLRAQAHAGKYQILAAD